VTSVAVVAVKLPRLLRRSREAFRAARRKSKSTHPQVHLENRVSYPSTSVAMSFRLIEALRLTTGQFDL
jgi:hypothetical protein